MTLTLTITAETLEELQKKAFDFGSSSQYADNYVDALGRYASDHKDPEEVFGWEPSIHVSMSERLRWISPPLYQGYDTVLGYLAKRRPDDLRWDLWEAEATQRDGWWLKHRCKERGLESFKVPAPVVLQEQGITEVNAYPVHLLAERLG